MTPSLPKVRALSKKYGTPFYIFRPDRFRDNHERLRRAFASRWGETLIGYSYKTNYLPALLKVAKDVGCLAEVVSGMEYELARKIGYKPERIIFNGPVKSEVDLIVALRSGSIANLDARREVETVVRFAAQNPSRDICVGLRINVHLADPARASRIQESLPVSRFGFADAAGGLESAIARLRTRPNVKIVSLHGHTSSSDRSVDVFRAIAARLVAVGETYHLDDIRYINVGGGMFGRVPASMRRAKLPTFDQYAAAICRVLRCSGWARHHAPALIIEPGVSIAADVLAFVTSVVDVKAVEDVNFAVVDGSILNVKPNRRPVTNPYRVLRTMRGGKRRRYHVVGSTCMEKDYLLTDIACGPLSVGDYFVIENVGAYTIVLSPPFIHPAPPILAERAGRYRLVRARQRLDDVFAGYLFR